MLPTAIANNRLGEQLNVLFTHHGLKRIGEQSLASLASAEDQLTKIAGISDVPMNDRDLLTAFDTKRKEDFRRGRIKTINGWVMADAECALCALIAIS